MSTITGIAATVRMSQFQNSGTINPLYIGAYGRQGGREFPLWSAGRGPATIASATVTFILGAVPANIVPADAVRVFDSQGSGWNNPDFDAIEIASVEYVYMRKAPDPSQTSFVRDEEFTIRIPDDDAQLESVIVKLLGQRGELRTFVRTREIGLAFQYGCQVWLTPLQ